MTPWPAAQLAGAAEGAAGTATTATSGTLSSAARKRKSLFRRSRIVAPTLIFARPEDPLAVSTMSRSRCVPRIGLTSVAKLSPARPAATVWVRCAHAMASNVVGCGEDHPADRRLEQETGRTLVLRDTNSVSLTADDEAEPLAERNRRPSHQAGVALRDPSRTKSPGHKHPPP